MGWAERTKRNGEADAPAYANRVDVVRGTEEVVLLFSFQRSNQDNRLIAEIALSPDHVERLGRLLSSLHDQEEPQRVSASPNGSLPALPPPGWVPPIHS